MRYTYNIVDGQSRVIEENLGSYEEGTTIIAMLTEQGVDTSTYKVVEREHYTVKGLGRDPDLH